MIGLWALWLKWPPLTRMPNTINVLTTSEVPFPIHYFGVSQP